MATTELEVANEALLVIKERPITDLDAGGKVPEILKADFPRARRDVLRLHDWTCAKSRVELVEITEESAGVPVINLSGRAHVFAEPTGIVRLIEVIDQSQLRVRFIKEKNRIYTDTEDPIAVVILDLDDPADWDPLLTSAIACMLAGRCAFYITGSHEHEQAAMQQAGAYIQQAKRQSIREARQRAEPAEAWYPGVYNEDKR